MNAAITYRISRYSCTCNEIRATHLKGIFEHATTQTLHGYSKNCNYNRNYRAGKMRQDWKASYQIKVCRTVWSAKNGQFEPDKSTTKLVTHNPLHPNVNVHILHTVLHTFFKVLAERICLTIKTFFNMRSFRLFSWPLQVIQSWYCKEK